MQLVMKGLSEGLSEYGEVIIFLDHSCKEPVNSKKFTIKMNPTLFPKIIRPYVKFVKLFFQDVNREDIFICDSWKSVSAIPGTYSNKIVTLAHGQEYLDQDKNSNQLLYKKTKKFLIKPPIPKKNNYFLLKNMLENTLNIYFIGIKINNQDRH